MTFKNWFKSTHDSNGFPEIWFKSTYDSKLYRVLIQINSWLKTLPEFWFKSTHDSKSFLESWFEWTHSSIDFSPYDLFVACPIRFHFVWPFLGFESTHYASSISEGWSIQLMTQTAFQEIDSESNHDSSESPGIDSDRLMTRVTFQGIDSESAHYSSGSLGIDSNRLMTQAKKHLILSRLIQLWVVRLSISNRDKGKIECIELFTDII